MNVVFIDVFLFVESFSWKKEKFKKKCTTLHEKDDTIRTLHARRDMEGKADNIYHNQIINDYSEEVPFT